ncbi:MULTISPECIES: HIT family protein [unclassified Lysobacter]|uniref:HIT domain-containing protein n=1 Tax=unclassified Lysobacter TaxID=2635362 RepID=UPI001BEBC5E4|nr:MULTISPECIES: HIT family protein [unclassified Lysobacter]MBT2748869.1 HIT domain-containing protein [Lysobacter sp. ISL-42]MBT2753103.1 HIT domain-containing protein [Lysobacter sp. ISL-50]MBT2777272.1 HIT domain-containing protein [Lysobacter sp. ISL-54]MBT2783252.1 HIT domain-containing protein [Lysobacter sp. ISL-52]
MNPWHLHPQLADDTHPIAQFELSELRLMDDANHPWLILVPRVDGAVELIDLSDAQQLALTGEIARASRALQAQFAPHKLNIAALGNLVPQLHVHVIARYREDIAWPRPVWGMATAQPYSPDLLVQRIRRLQDALAA